MTYAEEVKRDIDSVCEQLKSQTSGSIFENPQWYVRRAIKDELLSLGVRESVVTRIAINMDVDVNDKVFQEEYKNSYEKFLRVFCEITAKVCGEVDEEFGDVPDSVFGSDTTFRFKF